MRNKKANYAEKLLQSLVKIGLTHDEAACYVALLSEGSLDAKRLSAHINVRPHAIYRLMQSLQKKQFIVILTTTPRTFQAVPPSLAIDAYCENAKARLEKVKLESINSLSTFIRKTPSTRIDTIIGQNEVYAKAIVFTNEAKEEVLVVSIGREVSDEIKLAHRDANERGVVQRLLFQTYDNDNKEVLRSWLRMGMDVRYLYDGGYHLMIYDSKKSILVATNPENTAERTGMVIYSERLSIALRMYFYSLWERATQVDS